MSMQERKELAKAWVEEGKKSDIKVIIHVGAESLQEAHEFAAYCESIGADGIGSMSTVFFKPNSVNNLVEGMAYIAAGAPKTPFLYYHLPSMTGCKIGMPDFLTLAYEKIPTFAGIKFTDTTLNDITELQFRIDDFVKQGKKRVCLLFGVDEEYDVSVFMGLDGGVGSTYNYAAQVYVNIMEAYKAGDIDAVRMYQDRSQKFVRVFAKYTTNNYNAHKLLCSWTTGVDLGPPRLPYLELTDEAKVNFRKDLEDIGYFEWVKYIILYIYLNSEKYTPVRKFFNVKPNGVKLAGGIIICTLLTVAVGLMVAIIVVKVRMSNKKENRGAIKVTLLP